MRLLGNLSLLAAALGLTILGLELGFRIVNPQIFPVHPPGMYTPDPVVGYVPTPGFLGSSTRPEYETRVSVGTAGFRGRNPRPRGRNSLRILCLGDSFTWGSGVENREAWPHVVEQILRARYAGADIQVLNGGVPGYGTDEQLLYLQQRLLGIKPDLVIVAFFAGNDFRDNRSSASQSIEIRDGLLRTKMAQPAYATPIWLRINNWIKNRSHLHFFLSERLGYLATGAGLLDTVEEARTDFNAEDAQRAVDLLAEIASVSRASSSEVLLVFVPDKMHVLGSVDVKGARKVVADASGASNAPWLDLTPYLMEASEGASPYFYRFDPHWTADGHQVVAEAIADKLLSLQLIRLN